MPWRYSGGKGIDVDCVWNVMAHAQKPDFVFRGNGRVHLNRRGHQFSRLLAAEMCASPVVMLDTPCSEVVWRVLAAHYIRQFSLHFPSSASRVLSHFNWTLPVFKLHAVGGSKQYLGRFIPGKDTQWSFYRRLGGSRGHPDGCERFRHHWRWTPAGLLCRLEPVE
jgi:hypothetical protein